MKEGGDRFYPLTILRFMVGYASYFLSKLVFAILAIPMVIVLGPFPQAKDRVLSVLTHRYLAFFTRIWLPALGIYRLGEVSGLERARSSQPAIFVSNHRGFMDALLLLGLLPRTGVVIKSRYTRAFTYMLLARHFDLISINPDSLHSLSMALDKCRRVLGAGKRLVFFPEGTRARTGRLQRFSRTGFDLAVATGTTIFPVVIHSTWPFMAKVAGSIFPRGRNTFRILFLDPERPRADDDAQALSDRVYRRIAQELKRLDSGTFWEIGSPR
jgi:1-acyl-sn-glycerol-3-phosphate acyltransferase